MIYHGQVTGPGGEVYQCEHDHRTETAAITCANSSATRRMADMVWQRVADQAARDAALAKQLAEEREAAQARQSAEQAAAEARRAAAQAASEQAKAAKRAAKLAAMTPRRAWKHMTPAERLLRTADLEMQEYGEIRSPDALAAYEAQGTKPAVPEMPTESAPPRTPVSRRTSAAAARLKFAVAAGLILGGLAVLVAGVLDAVVALVYYKVTVPNECAIAQPDGSVVYSHLPPQCNGVGAELAWGTGLVFGVAVLLWLLTVVINSLSPERQQKVTDWAKKPREARRPLLGSRYTASVSAVTPRGTRVRQRCCQRGHPTPDAAARHAAAVKLRIERRGV
ncbi:MAG: hypothetical protein ACRDOA_11445 [Streptosporangiaceae bacterium]